MSSKKKNQSDAKIWWKDYDSPEKSKARGESKEHRKLHKGMTTGTSGKPAERGKHERKTINDAYEAKVKKTKTEKKDKIEKRNKALSVEHKKERGKHDDPLDKIHDAGHKHKKATPEKKATPKTTATVSKPTTISSSTSTKERVTALSKAGNRKSKRSGLMKQKVSGT